MEADPIDATVPKNALDVGSVDRVRVEKIVLVPLVPIGVSTTVKVLSHGSIIVVVEVSVVIV